MASQEIASQEIASHEIEGLASVESLRRASVNDRYGRAALFAAGVCVLGMLAFLAGQLGWWAMLAGPAYLAGVAVAAMFARGRSQALLAIALATGSMATLVGLFKLAGLA